MKLLGLRVCEHDSNFTYFDGDKLHYFKTERKYQVKHHGVKDLNIWENIINEEWGITSKDLDEIAIVFDPWHYNLNSRNESFFPAIDYFDFPADCKVSRVNHHYAHHLSCFPLTNQTCQNGIVIDGFGDLNKSWSVIKNNKIVSEGSEKYNGSIGLEMCKVGSLFNLVGHKLDMAGKVMSLQSYGRIDNDFYNFLRQFDIDKIKDIFDHHYYCQDKIDWLRTTHEYVGDLLVKFFSKFFDKNDIFCFSGGVALDVCWNSKLRNYFKNIIIPPHCNDEGLSLGAIEYLRIKHKLRKFKINNFPFCQNDISPNTSPEKNLIVKVCDLLKNQKIIGWYQGNGEIGPRALGNRSILADPREKQMREKINKIKKREEFRPFGCSTINKNFKKDPFMLYAEPIDVNSYPAVAHVDKTSRHQTVSSGLFYDLITQFYKQTNCDTLLNTSLNINGKPLCYGFSDAFNLFQNSELDAFVYGGQLFLK